MSYGGLLSYIITFYAEDGSGSTNQEPQVMIRGGTLKKFVIYKDMVTPGNGVRTQHDIRMTEVQWDDSGLKQRLDQWKLVLMWVYVFICYSTSGNTLTQCQKSRWVALTSCLSSVMFNTSSSRLRMGPDCSRPGLYKLYCVEKQVWVDISQFAGNTVLYICGSVKVKHNVFHVTFFIFDFKDLKYHHGDSSGGGFTGGNRGHRGHGQADWVLWMPTRIHWTVLSGNVTC